MKINTAIKRSFVGLSFLLLLGSASQAAVLLKVDFGTSSSPLNTGFEAFNSATATENTTAANATQVYATTQGNITVKFEFATGQTLAGGVSRNRGTAPAEIGSFTQPNLMRDLFQQVNETVNGTTLFFTGLAANTQYQIKLYSYDHDSNLSSIFTLYNTTTTTGVGGTKTGTGTGTLLSTFSNQSGVGTFPDDNNDYSSTSIVTSSSTGFISLGHNSTVGTGAINGFELAAIPEPSSMMACVTGAALLLTRRRRAPAGF